MKLLDVKTEFCINKAWGSIFKATCIRPNLASMFNVVPCAGLCLKNDSTQFIKNPILKMRVCNNSEIICNMTKGHSEMLKYPTWLD